MPKRIQRTYYRSLVGAFGSLQGLGSDFDGVVSLDQTLRQGAEYLASRTRRNLHAPVLDFEYPIHLRRKGRYRLIDLEPREVEPKAIRSLFQMLIDARLSTHQARRWMRLQWRERQPIVTLATHAPVRITSSRTPGHSHLFIEREIPWNRYELVLIALEEARLIDHARLSSYLLEETSFVRLPAPH